MPDSSAHPTTYRVDSAGHWLRADAAASYLRMLAAGMPTGGIDVFGRTLAEQRVLYDRYRAGKGPLAAKPSPTAPHVMGVAMDAHTTTAGKYAPSAAHKWLTAGGDGSSKPKAGEKLRAHDHGWRRTVPSERWHFGYDRAKDKHRAKDLAARLKSLGYPDVKAFQRAHGLTADGVDGPLTWGALLNQPTPAPERPTPVPSLPVSTLARVATWNCGAFGKTSMSAQRIDAIVGVLLKVDASIYTLTECPEWLRNHIRGACRCPATVKAGGHRRLPGGASRWLVRVRGSQCILRDSRKWQSGPHGSMTFGPTSYHGALWETLTQTTTKARLTIGCYHLPPNVVATDAFQKSKLAALLGKLGVGARLLGGDGADESGWVTGWDDSRTAAAASDNRAAATYGSTIRDRIHVKGIAVRRYTVYPTTASDHNPVLAQITILATNNTL